jgi:glycine/D-amino acid oxidase-like deaminating enzyme
MSRTRYGVSPWLEGIPKTRRPAYPHLADSLTVPVTVVGGGLTGTATVYALAAAGVRSVLVEADRIGSSATALAPGLVLADPAGLYLDHEAALGRKAARAAWQSTRRAALEMGAAIRRLGIKCALATLDGVTYAKRQEHVKRLRRELQARKDAGLDGTWLSPSALAGMGLQGAGGLRTRGHARLDPVRAAQGFARAAAVRGAGVFERSPVTRIRATRTGIEIVTARGTITSTTVIVTTGDPTRDFHALERHFTPLESYAVMTPPLPAAVRAALKNHDVLVQDADQPPHRLFWTSDERIVWSGADQTRTPARGREKVLVQRTGQLMYELLLTLDRVAGVVPEYGWHVPYSRTSDALPFIGPHRNYPQHLFAFGLGTNVTNSFLASRILLRHCTDSVEKDDEAFGFTRLAR